MLDGADHQPKIAKLLAQQGNLFPKLLKKEQKTFILRIDFEQSICCDSRCVSLLREKKFRKHQPNDKRLRTGFELFPNVRNCFLFNCTSASYSYLWVS